MITLLVIRVAETGKAVQSPLHVYKGSLHAGRIMYNTNQHPFLCQTVNTAMLMRFCLQKLCYGTRPESEMGEVHSAALKRRLLGHCQGRRA